MDQVVAHRLHYALARVLEPKVAVAFVGKEDRVSQVFLGVDGVGIARVGIKGLIDQ